MSKKSLFTALHTLADEYRKEAGLKQAGPVPADPGGMDGKSQHASASVDNGCQTPTPGAHASENSADISEQQGAPSVQNTADAKPGDDKDRSLNLGMQASYTGEDVPTPKPGKDDPGTSSPAKVDDGEKFASLSFKEAAARSADLGNQILADLFTGLNKTAAPATPAAAAAAAAAAPAAGATSKEAQFREGYELAGAMGLSKEAAEAQVSEIAEHTIRDALLEAELVGNYFKTASDDAAEGEDHSTPGGTQEDGGSGAGEGEGSGDASRTSGGEGPGGGAPAGDPLAGLGGGGAPGGAPGGGAPGGGMNQEQALQELVMAMQELGITPEMLEQAVSGAGGAPGGAPMGGGAPGGMPGGAPAGGPPPMGGDPLAMGAAGAGAGPAPGGPPPEAMKLARAARSFMRSGKFEFKQAGSKEARELRNKMKLHLQELMA